MDSLHYYPYYLGKIEQAKKSGQSGKKKAEDFVNYIRANSENGRTIYLSLLNLADFYDHIGEENLSLDVTSEALEISKTVLDIKLNESGKVKYNLGVCYNTQGDHTAAKSYFYQALRDYESSENPDYENLSNTYNALGAMMWLSSKLDSAKIYYSKSVESLEKNETDPIENLYLTAIINSNITLADYFQGDIASAITMQEKVVKDYQKVINRSTVALTKSKAEKNQINSISNLAVFYNEMGFMNRANQIINYAYQKRINLLEPNDPTLRQTLIQVAQSEISMKEFKQAIDHLDEALDGMKTYGDENNYWKGAALYAKAEAYIAIGKIEEARALYTESEKLFEVSVGEEYDREFLGFLRKKALFLAQNDDKEAAVKSAFKGFNYVSENGKELMIPYVKHFVNLAEVYFNIEDYENAKLWSLKGLEMIAEQNQNINAIKKRF